MLESLYFINLIKNSYYSSANANVRNSIIKPTVKIIKKIYITILPTINKLNQETTQGKINANSRSKMRNKIPIR